MLEKEHKRFYVYQYVRIRNSKYGNIGSPYYIGKGQNNRAYDKKHSILPPKDKNRIQFISQHMSEIDAFQLEMLLIYMYGRIDLETGCLRNRTNGGDGTTGHIHTKETKEKMSLAQLGKAHWNYGKQSSKETKQKMSFARKGKPRSELFRIAITKARTGTHLSEATKEKIANSLKGELSPNFGKKFSKETKDKMALAQLGKQKSEEEKIKMRKPRRKKKCPHCDVIGGNNMLRYHFDKCKKKEN